FKEFPEAEYQLGSALLAKRDLDGAAEAFRRALEYREDWSLALAGLGHTLLRKGDLTAAEKVLSDAIKKDETNYPALASLVELRIKQGADAAALRELLATVSALTSKANPTPSLWA